MYGVVLSAMLTMGTGTPAWGCSSCWSCKGCSGWYGCAGNALSCGGYWSVCRGCWGCGGCSGCCGGYWSACAGCCGGYVVGYGCAGWGCAGCCGGVVVQPMQRATDPRDKQIEELKKKVDQLDKQLKGKSGEREAQAAPARVTVQVPADAKLLIDDVVCPLTSESRTFDTPPLQSGQAYYYILTAEVTRAGRPVTEKQRVIVEAGKQVIVEFKSLPAVATARR